MCRIHISSRDTHFSPHVTPAHRTGCQGILQTLGFHLPLSRQFLVQREREGEKVFTHSVKSQADALVYQINQSVVRLRAHISSRVPTPAQTAPSARVLTRYSTFSVFYRAELPLGGSSLKLYQTNQPASQTREWWTRACRKTRGRTRNDPVAREGGKRVHSNKRGPLQTMTRTNLICQLLGDHQSLRRRHVGSSG